MSAGAFFATLLVAFVAMVILMPALLSLGDRIADALERRINRWFR